QCPKPSGIKLYDDRLELGSGDRKACLVIAAREHADAPGSAHEIAIATVGADPEAELAFGDEADMRPMPSPADVLSAAGIVPFQQSGVSIAGTICPPTIPLTCSLGLFWLDINEFAWSLPVFSP